MFYKTKTYFKSMERKTAVFIALLLLFGVAAVVLLRLYFNAYSQPYMLERVVRLSEGWQYSVNGSETKELDTGPMLPPNEPLVLYRVFKEDEYIENAAIMVRANHQSVNVYIDETPLYIDRELEHGENPGMALRFIALPNDYSGKTLRIELTSPYALYSGRTGTVFLGTIQSLEAFALSSSMNSVIMMAMCLLLGFAIIALTLIQALQGERRPENLALGIFALIWALYYVCTDYIVFQFFPPFLVSALSLGLYFSFQAPLALYFYFSFKHYKKLMFPATVIHVAFPVVALFLQITGIIDLPVLLNINNIILAGLVYTLVLCVLEAFKRTRMMAIVSVFFLLSYIAMLYNFSVFYTRHGVPPYSYRTTYFLLLLCVLVYNIQQFFRSYYRHRQENETLALQHKMATDNYEQIKTHIQEIGGLKHEIINHLAALKTLLKDNRYDEATAYLEKYTEQSAVVTEALYHEHYIINALVGGLHRKAKISGIKTEVNLKSTPKTINAPDLYSLLSNIINNALEACAKMPEDRERFIRLSISRREPYLTVVCENSYDGEIIRDNGALQSAKKESGHGYGLWMIERIVKAYNGHMDADYNEKTFTLTVALRD